MRNDPVPTKSDAKSSGSKPNTQRESSRRPEPGVRSTLGVTFRALSGNPFCGCDAFWWFHTCAVPTFDTGAVESDVGNPHLVGHWHLLLALATVHIGHADQASRFALIVFEHDGGVLFAELHPGPHR